MCLLEPLPVAFWERNGRLGLVAGLSPRNPEGRFVDEENGVAVFHKPKEGAEPVEPDLVYRITLFLVD